ncbi:ras-specific guanine nucleotide-releasing factor RalGPS1-like [Rhincodon typus]|uniref:ras-specific guanine nucleotide-releasing factor RalGPS1-like n=1 Tax=Rhincodon typus TaxID=259920 RepID=UPI00202DDB8A|nr:ras-specific guanine nucleotide-releasing factor RalGPS1-like [Rhincodon typus]XP_048474025.1 ras-specific guanine nucleotide-releasing factor RalGPS1-like [Rhincodon typus]XP_048474027.1 ras-specific guanine nucleotide-releasing factor RalGPS1-like [Rhincodon typus]XP_048474028.1 ras-specific guanine nucleotide-releasing factor RalGPS1-like [Rhincodon typus]
MEVAEDVHSDIESDRGLENPAATSSQRGSCDLNFDAVVFDILMVTPEEFASQITQLDIPSFRAIRHQELSDCSWNKKEKHTLAPNVVAFTRRFNQVSFWVIQEILTKQSLKRRVEVVGHFIKIAKKLQGLHNLHGLMAVVSALQSTPVFRLSKTWALLSRKDKAVFEKLQTLMSSDNNYKELRDYINCLKETPCIPYLGIYLSDLTYIDAAFPQSTETLEKKHRCDLINNVLRVIFDFQQFCEYDLPTLPHVEKYLNSQRYIEELQGFLEQDNYRLSLKIQPATCAQHPVSTRDSRGSLSASEETKPCHGDASVTYLCLTRGHRRWRSVDYKAGQTNTSNHRSATFPGSWPRYLLDDSEMEGDASWVMQARASQEESCDVGERKPCSSFERNSGFYCSLGRVTRSMWNPLRSPIGAMLHPDGGATTMESVLRRKTVLKDSRKPAVRGAMRHLCSAWFLTLFPDVS